ncbi:MAG: DUF1707 SHOCT-like domain-containing protein [Acidimicrobiales bacterium]
MSDEGQAGRGHAGAGSGVPDRVPMSDAGTSGPPPVRVSDADRDAAAARLRDHCGEGRLTLDEFRERIGAVFAAQTRADLDRVMVDLPAIPAPVPERARRPSTGWTVSVMGGSSRRGRWRPRARTNVVAVMGGCDLDLRHAEIDGDEVVITAVALMGGIDIVVPEGIEVDLTGIPIMGGKDLQVKPVPLIPGAPRIRVRAFPIMGGVSVRSKSGDDASGGPTALGPGFGGPFAHGFGGGFAGGLGGGRGLGAGPPPWGRGVRGRRALREQILAERIQARAGRHRRDP